MWQAREFFRLQLESYEVTRLLQPPPTIPPPPPIQPDVQVVRHAGFVLTATQDQTVRGLVIALGLPSHGHVSIQAMRQHDS